MESPSESEAERVPERLEVVVSEEESVSVMEPAVGVFRTGALFAPLMVMVISCVESVSYTHLRAHET